MAAGAGGGGGEPKSWLESLPETMRGDRNLAKYESLEAFAKGHINVLARMGKDPERLIEMPAKPDDVAGWDAFWAKLGRPAKADEYKIALADGANDQDKAFLEGFRETAHKAGLTQAQLEAAVGYVSGITTKAAADATAASEKAAAETTAALKGEWGGKFDTYTKEIGKLIEDLGGAEAVEALNADGLGNSQTLLKMLAKVVDLRAEPGSLPGGRGGGSDLGMTPYQAQGALAAFHGDAAKMEALNKKDHPMHKVVYEERQNLLKAAYPSQPT